MKVSLSKFYHEVTGSKTGNRPIVIPALKRWGVPFDETAASRVAAVDVIHLPAALQAYQREEEQRAEKRKATAPKSNGHGTQASVLERLTALETAVDTLIRAQGANGLRMDEALDLMRATGPKFADIVNVLNKLYAQPRRR